MLVLCLVMHNVSTFSSLDVYLIVNTIINHDLLIPEHLTKRLNTVGPGLSSSSKKGKTDESDISTTLKPHHSKHHSKSGNKSLDDVEEVADEGWNYENTTIVDTRRILFSKKTEKGKRPYMVSQIILDNAVKLPIGTKSNDWALIILIRQ